MSVGWIRFEATVDGCDFQRRKRAAFAVVPSLNGSLIGLRAGDTEDVSKVLKKSSG